MGVGENVGGTIGARGAPPGTQGEESRTGIGAPFGSRPAVRIKRVRERVTSTSDDSQYESAGEPVRQCQLRKLHENLKAGGNLREQLRGPWAHACEHRRIH